MRHHDKKDTFQQGVQLKRANHFLEAITCFEPLLDPTPNTQQTNPDLCFNLGVCYWKCGNLAPAVELLERTIQLNGTDPDAQAILKKIWIQHPYPQLPDFRKDGAILDANFIINFCKENFNRFQKFIRKAQKRFNFYTSHQVYDETNQPNIHVKYPVSELQQILKAVLIVMPIPPQEIHTLERLLFSEFSETDTIKLRHADRLYAWENDLSLICLLDHIHNPFKYIVSNDQGIQQIMGHLHQGGDPQLYLRPNDLFIATVNEFCRTARRPTWEQRIYGKIA